MKSIKTMLLGIAIILVGLSFGIVAMHIITIGRFDAESLITLLLVLIGLIVAIYGFTKKGSEDSKK